MTRRVLPARQSAGLAGDVMRCDARLTPILWRVRHCADASVSYTSSEFVRHQEARG
jgi:hypothetical protein